MKKGKHVMGGCWKGISLLCLILAAAIVSLAQDSQSLPKAVTFKTLVNFDGANGSSVFGGLVQGTDGNLYGTTQLGGAITAGICSPTGCGTVFKMTPAGKLTTIYSFCSEPNCADGAGGNDGPLALGTDGNLYGTTVAGGASFSSGPCAGFGCGTIFKITPTGKLTTLYNFCSQPNCIDGDINYNGMVRGADGNFYGTTQNGGVNNNPMCIPGFGVGCGTVFKITPAGVFATIYSFCSQTNCADGDSPSAGLFAGADGNLYGMTAGGGANGSGTIFRLTLEGKFTTLHSFNFTDGTCQDFCSQMIQANNGNLYGTTELSGTNADGTAFEISPNGGALTTLYNFCSQTNCADGRYPAGLVQAADGNFYGPTIDGGSTSCRPPYGCGTIFKITPGGVRTTVYGGFDATVGNGVENLTQATNGTFYGTTLFGGTSNDGTVFSLSVGLKPFIETLQTSGEVGETIQILGNDLTSATSVSFNGTAAAFTVDSKTLISATVPAGAITGFVTVTGPNATLKSNVRFRVRQ